MLLSSAPPLNERVDELNHRHDARGVWTCPAGIVNRTTSFENQNESAKARLGYNNRNARASSQIGTLRSGRRSAPGIARLPYCRRSVSKIGVNEVMNTTTHQSAPFSKNESVKQTITLTLLGLLLAAMPAPTWAEDDDAKKETIPFSDARIRIEVNATDGDSGLHVLLDAEGWKHVRIYDPKGKLVFYVAGGGSVKKTGLTELFFESAEPGFEELPLDEFLKRFPAGEYQFVGLTITGKTLSSKAILTHALPNGPVLLSPAEGSVQDPANTVIKWQPVADPPGSRIVRYEVIVVDESSVPKRVLSAVVPATVTSMVVPPTFLLPNGSYKYEVLAIEAGGNQTLSETAFRTGP